MKAAERSDKLPRYVTVRLMKICENCEFAELEVETDKVLFGYPPRELSSNRIVCKNEHLCRNLIEHERGTV